mmetsp:Transcript_7323/g.19079  ORF Transcript_7323/g.19079 Transcript_7323/m.19079 type:complete len:229 (-) Transcript_7323:1317-2003(-)
MVCASRSTQQHAATAPPGPSNSSSSAQRTHAALSAVSGLFVEKEATNPGKRSAAWRDASCPPWPSTAQATALPRVTESSVVSSSLGSLDGQSRAFKISDESSEPTATQSSIAALEEPLLLYAPNRIWATGASTVSASPSPLLSRSTTTSIMRCWGTLSRVARAASKDFFSSRSSKTGSSEPLGTYSTLNNKSPTRGAPSLSELLPGATLLTRTPPSSSTMRPNGACSA